MHCTQPRTSASNFEEEDRKSNFQSRNFVEKENINSSTEDPSEVTTAGWRDHDRRCAVYLLTPEPDGQCKLVALPLRYVYQVNQLGSTTPSIAVSSPQPKNGGTANTFIVPKEETSKKRNSGKKKKKKGKKKKKLPREIGKTSSENVPECGASQTDDKNDTHNRVVPLASASKLADLSPENCGDENCSEGTSARDYQCTSCIEAAGVSKSLTPSLLSNCNSDHHKSEFGDGIQTAGVQGIQYGVSSCPDVLSERPILGSPSLDSNCEKINSGYCSTLCNEENDGIKLVKSLDCVVREECSGNTFHDIENQRTNCGRQLCHLEMPEKRVKKIKRGPQNPSVCSVRNLHRPGVRETVHSVWQKVQNSEACKHKNDSKNLNAVCSQFYNESKEASMREKHINAVCCSLKSDSALKKQASTKVFAKTKRKNNLGSKQEFNNHYRNGSQAIRDNSDLCKNFNMQQNELCAIPKHMNGETRPGIESKSHSKDKFAALGFHTRKVESIRLRRPESSEANFNEVELLDSCYASTSSLIDHNVECRTCYSLTSSSSLNTPELLEKLSDIQLHTPVDHKEFVTDEDCFAPSDHKKDFSSAAVWQKWKPTRNSGLNDSGVYGGLSMMKNDEPAGVTRVEGNIIEQDLVSDLCGSICAASSGSTCKRESFNDVNNSPLTNVVQVKDFGNQTVSTVKEYSNSTKCFAPESSNQKILTPDNNSNKLLSAVTDSYRAQVASEAIQLATGCPIAEFEKFVHSASPVICTSPTTVNCQKCSQDISHAFLCQHEVPNISLGKLWQWYEKHGSYGLEVRVDYENSCRLGIDSLTFRAYFVPYLSAVQLFNKSKGLHHGNGISAASAMEKGEMVESSEISNINHVLSLLVPQPRESESMLAPDEHAGSKPSGSFTEDISVSQADCGGSDQLEILFEYFESEQPQRRRPLYDMINELVRGNASSRGRVLGDGTILNSVSICDLHPTSWYSVAWYPIYRIPEGNFRAAFLTYHSLGHLIQRQTASDSTCVDESVVSPVVGLQTYNTQGECWLQPKHSEDVVNSVPARILKERLRTLEQTASLMARAVVTKGNETTVNRQPDYEFFLSRQMRQSC